MDYIDNSTALELTYRVKVKTDYVSFSDEIYDRAKENEKTTVLPGKHRWMLALGT